MKTPGVCAVTWPTQGSEWSMVHLCHSPSAYVRAAVPHGGTTLCGKRVSQLAKRVNKVGRLLVCAVCSELSGRIENPTGTKKRAKMGQEWTHAEIAAATVEYEARGGRIERLTGFVPLSEERIASIFAS